MRLSVLSIGRLKAGPEKILAEDYQKRLGAMGRTAGITRLAVIEFAESQAQTPSQRMADEAKLLSQAIEPTAFTFLLDERGKSFASAEFAKLLQKHVDGGTQDMSFVIGGPDGLDPDFKKSNRQLMSFGPMTWPHRLVRVMLFEQIYRAVTIMVNHPYHRP